MDNPPDSPLDKQAEAFTRRIAFVGDDPHATQALASSLRDTKGWSEQQWQTLIDACERNGLSPLFYHHLQKHQPELPSLTDKVLKALTIRHRRAHQIRTEALAEILIAYQAASIDCLLLKGAALAHLIYPTPSLRPMGDIDVLVKKADAQKAQQTLRDLGYFAADAKQRFLAEHHHLPAATRSDAGMTIQVEVHHDALSGDVKASLSFDHLQRPLQTFQVNSEIQTVEAHTFSHADTLRHLCHHTFEPAERIKLISIVDLVTYADHFRDEIDWQTLAKQQPFVINTLRCVHYLRPLPARLTKAAPELTPPATPAPDGIGKSFTPLSTVLASTAGKKAKLKQLFLPAAWWLHVFYQVPPENSLFLTRWLHHPSQLAQWVFRRYRAAWRSRST